MRLQSWLKTWDIKWHWFLVKLNRLFFGEVLCLITDFLLIQTTVCKHLYTSNKIFLKLVLGHQSALSIFQHVWKPYMAHTLTAAPTRFTMMQHSVNNTMPVSIQGGLAIRRLPGCSEACTTGKVLSSAFLTNLSNVQLLSYKLRVRVSWVHQVFLHPHSSLYLLLLFSTGRWYKLLLLLVDK